MRYAVTGATGFIGSEIIRTLIGNDSTTVVYAIARAQANKAALARMQTIIDHWQRYFSVPETSLAKIKVIETDLTGNPAFLKHEVTDADYVFHCAASTDIGMPLYPARAINLVGTQKVVAWARELPSLKRFVHFSTAYVSGTQRGPIDELTLPTQFNNGYEQSKWEAERVIAFSGLPYTIVRPSLVVGNTQNGYIRGYKIIYAALRAWMTKAMPRAPLDAKAHVDIVPVDYVVRASLKLAELAETQGEIYHLTSGRKASSAMEIFRYAIDVFSLGRPPMSYPWIAKLLTKPMVRPFLGHGLRNIVELMNSHVPYLGTRNRFFVTDKVNSVLRAHQITCPDLSEYGETIFRFCRDSSWGKRPLIAPSQTEPHQKPA